MPDAPPVTMATCFMGPTSSATAGSAGPDDPGSRPTLQATREDPERTGPIGTRAGYRRAVPYTSVPRGY